MKLGISKVAYTSTGSTITHVMIHEIVNQDIKPGEQITKKRVIELIESGHECWTILEKGAGNWHWGAEVHVVKTVHGKYIRTDKNNISEDNLGNLPTFVPKVESYSY